MINVTFGMLLSIDIAFSYFVIVRLCIYRLQQKQRAVIPLLQLSEMVVVLSMEIFRFYMTIGVCSVEQLQSCIDQIIGKEKNQVPLYRICCPYRVNCCTLCSSDLLREPLRVAG